MKGFDPSRTSCGQCKLDFPTADARRNHMWTVHHKTANLAFEIAGADHQAQIIHLTIERSSDLSFRCPIRGCSYRAYKHWDFVNHSCSPLHKPLVLSTRNSQKPKPEVKGTEGVKSSLPADRKRKKGDVDFNANPVLFAGPTSSSTRPEGSLPFPLSAPKISTSESSATSPPSEVKNPYKYHVPLRRLPKPAFQLPPRAASATSTAITQTLPSTFSAATVNIVSGQATSWERLFGQSIRERSMRR
ncbi:hypothetical protein BJ508DRAFT_49759 [Ascobolus immersus RN42]|uniref:Uncharacterized protein n=1 Tax=Ascobolus immersus RN42 TaxID=1160509 RepID=A0A3N4HHG6_ASCIM|nr:hypothetical protein BJ508DRAFT_49759 [Ascobolus immersus RN42]